MSEINSKQREYLEKQFGDRVNFQHLERKLYGHDIAAIPGLVKPFIGSTVPDAVVQPQNEAELCEFVKWAVKNKIPLTPRGKASSGYGGVLPMKKGIVVDFYRMKEIKNIDAKAMTATVQTGVVFERLDKTLLKQGLTLMMYPSSYPSATVGGWLAQGGAGIGSFEYGWFQDVVVSARVVMPDGTVREFRDKELDMISSTEGITGFITEVTLRVMPAEEQDVIAIGCPEADSIAHIVQVGIDNKLPVWSVIFINPKMAEMKNDTPLREHMGHTAEKRVLLPKAYISIIAFRKKDREVIKNTLAEAMKKCKGEFLSDEIAHHEWENRFKIMVVKRLGPSLVPAEVVVPLANLGKVMKEIEQKVGQPVVKEGIITKTGKSRRPEAVILGFIPCDQRKLGYNFVFGLTLTITKIAEKYGGRPYAAGLYFAGAAERVYGKKKLARIKAFKQQVDPAGIFNPNKVINGGVTSMLINIARVFEPLIRPLGNSVSLKIGERPDKPVKDIPADVAWYAYGCSQCGYCVDECDQFYGRGWESQSPRGKWYWLREYMEGREKWNQFMVDTILVCTTCELCNLRCSASLPIEPSWMKLRGILITDEKRLTIPPFEMMGASLQKEGDIWAAPRKERDAWFPEDLVEKHGPGHKAKMAYFAGCTASHVEQDIAMASVRLLDAAGVDFTYLGKKENCCGTPMLVCGKWDVFEQNMRQNIKNMQNSGADTVITSCPACDMMWRHTYPKWAEKLGIKYDFKVKHYSEVLAEKIKTGEFKFPKKIADTTVAWHDSCHIGRVSGVYDAPRDLIKAIPGVNLVEMDHCREEAHCCGSVLTLIKDPPVAAEIGKSRIDEALDAGADKLLALCPCCQFQFRVAADKKKLPMEVVDLARFAAGALGYSFPDPNPEVQKQWAVFEAMIALMTPEGFAQLMGTMWPEMIDAMPFKMGPMMRFMGKIPGALNLMKPVFPILFPRLLPMMMPKVMPVMLSRVADAVPMPDYMAAQMPDLMPKIMDNLMPHMIGDVVPLVMQPMIDYLKGKGK